MAVSGSEGFWWCPLCSVLVPLCWSRCAARVGFLQLALFLHHVTWLSLFPVRKSVQASHVLSFVCVTMSIREFVESVEWDGKDASWDTLICNTLELNDIKSLEQIGRARVTVEKLLWEDDLSIGKKGFAEACARFPACPCGAVLVLVCTGSLLPVPAAVCAHWARRSQFSSEWASH